MATISIVLPDGINSQLVEAFCAKYGYANTVNDGSGHTVPNPVSSGLFTQNAFVQFGKEVIKSHLTEKAAQAAREQTAAAVDTTFSQATITIEVQ